MPRIIPPALLPALLIVPILLLGACGHHGHDGDEATSASVEMPAADLPAGPPSLAAPPPAKDPDADASHAAAAAQAAATTDAENAASVAEQARAAAREAETQDRANPPAQGAQ